MCRAVVIGTKFGFYSDSHFKILQSFKLSSKFLNAGLIGEIINENSPVIIFKKFERLLNNLSIQRQIFYFEIIHQ